MKSSLVILLIFVFLAPDMVSAQGLVGGVCEGTECSSCDIVVIANNFISWLIGAVMVLFAVLMVLAGFGLVTSQGNPDALNKAKGKFTNAIVGLIIVLSAWLIVDTIMRGLVGNNGVMTGYGPWSEIDCAEQVDPTVREGEVAIEAASIISSDTERCALDSTTGGYTDCDALVSACEGEASVDQIDPSERRVTCEIQSGVDVGQDGVCSTPASELVTLNFMGGSVTVHRQHAASARAVNAEWESRGGQSYYRVNLIGSYSPRNISGSSRCSYHSQGGAIDINWGGGAGDSGSPNPHCPSWSACNGQNILITDMDTQSPPFYTVFTSNGWRWGGRWNSSKDAMHFSPSGR